MNLRIIPRLDIKGPNLVKGVHLEGLRVLGNPSDFAKHYYEAGADELCYMDAVASLYGRNSLLGMIEETAKNTFIPLCVGGGIQSVEDIRQVLRAGGDKVAINTAAIKRPELIREAAEIFGSSTIVISIEAIQRPDGSYEAYTDYGREQSGKDAVQWAEQAVSLGAGEISLTAIQKEGAGKGADLKLCKEVVERVPVPVICHGGIGSYKDIQTVAKEGVSAISLASLLHYGCAKEILSEGSKSEGNREFLNTDSRFLDFEAISLSEIKEKLRQEGYTCRPSSQKEVNREAA